MKTCDRPVWSYPDLARRYGLLTYEVLRVVALAGLPDRGRIGNCRVAYAEDLPAFEAALRQKGWHPEQKQAREDKAVSA
jgi:hypothetical protein